MNGKSVNCDAVMGELVDRPLRLAPIEFALPRPGQLAKIAAIEAIAPAHVLHFGGPESGCYPRPDRKRVAQGKSVEVRVDIGVRRLIRKTMQGVMSRNYIQKIRYNK